MWSVSSASQSAPKLNRIAERRGLPLMIVSDNGTELTSHAILGWQAERGVAWHYNTLVNSSETSRPA